MLRTLRIGLLMALAVVAFPMRTLAAQDHVSSTVSASPAHPLPPPEPSPLPLDLMAFAVVGATTAARKMNLSRSYLFTDGQTYGPGVNVEVPEGFPELDDKGDVIHPPGSAAARNQAGSRRTNFASPPNTGGVNTGESRTGAQGTGVSVSGKTSAELEAMDKAELIDLAGTFPDVTVERLDDAGEVEDGEPLKRDYVRALGATATR